MSRFRVPSAAPRPGFRTPDPRFSRRRPTGGVKVRIHRRIVVHLELTIDLQPLSAGEKVVQQFAERAGQIVVLLGEDLQPGLGLGEVALLASVRQACSSM